MDATLGDRIARMRGYRRMSQQELGDLTGLHAQNISRLETGGRGRIWSDTLIRFAQALDCSADYLLGLSDDPTPPRRVRRRRALAPDESEDNERAGVGAWNG